MAVVKAPNIDFDAADPPNNAAQPVDPVGGVVIVVVAGTAQTPAAAPAQSSGAGDSIWAYPIGS